MSTAAETGRHEVGPRHGQDGTGSGGADALDRTSIVLRAYASPLPLGLFAFAIGNVRPHDLTASTAWERVSGVVAAVVAASASYLAVALVIEDVKHRTVLPVGRVGGTESRSAMEGGLASQARSLAHEAGVRAQL